MTSLVLSCPGSIPTKTVSHHYSEAAHGEVLLAGLGAGGLGVDLLLLESTADLAGLLRAQVQRQVLLAGVLLPGLCLLLLVVHCQDPGNGLAHGLDLRQLGSGAARHLRHTQLGQLTLHVVQLLQQLLGGLVAQLIRLHAHHGLKQQSPEPMVPTD